MSPSARAVALAAALALAPALAHGAEKAVFTPAADLEWINAGIPGVDTAQVQGDMKKGASRFYLRYASGFVAPVHHHSPDHFATTVTGNLVLIVDGKEHRLPPGSYFAFTGKAKHAVRGEGAEACGMFIDARGSGDVVVPKPKGAK